MLVYSRLPPLLPRRGSTALFLRWTAAAAGPEGLHAAAPAEYLTPRHPGSVLLAVVYADSRGATISADGRHIFGNVLARR